MSTSRLPRSAFSDPARISPPRRPGSVRRTTNVDIRPEEGGWLVIEGAGRDFITTVDGTTRTLDESTVTAVLDADRIVRDLAGVPAEASNALVGARVGRGFRAAVRQWVVAGKAPPVLRLLLEDLPVAVLLSGYQRVYGGGTWDDGVEPGTLGENVCSGWRTGGTLLTTVRATGRVVLSQGPSANPLDGDDSEAWHELQPLSPNSMRRQRLLDVGCGTPRPIAAHVRDCHADEAGRPTILHEWSVTARYDDTTDRFNDVEAAPQVLPLPECPAAADSARRLSGCTSQMVRDRLRTDFQGVSTCTHLTDLLRSLSDVPALIVREH